MVDQRLSNRDEDDRANLNIIGVVVDGVDLIEGHARRKRICRLRRPVCDIDVEHAGQDKVAEQLPHTDVHRCYDED